MMTITSEMRKQIAKCDYMVLRNGNLIVGYKEDLKNGNEHYSEIDLGIVNNYFSSVNKYKVVLNNNSWKSFIKKDDRIFFSITDHTNMILQELELCSIAITLNILRGNKSIQIDVFNISCKKSELEYRIS